MTIQSPLATITARTLTQLNRNIFASVSGRAENGSSSSGASTSVASTITKFLCCRLLGYPRNLGSVVSKCITYLYMGYILLISH